MNEFIGGLIQNIEAAFRFLVLITRDSPVGLWSAAGALVMPAVLAPMLMKYIPEPSFKRPLQRQLIIDLLTTAAGIAVAWLPWQTLNGLLVGVVCGLSSAMFWRLLSTVFGPLWLAARRKLGVEDWKARA